MINISSRSPLLISTYISSFFSTHSPSSILQNSINEISSLLTSSSLTSSHLLSLSLNHIQQTDYLQSFNHIYHQKAIEEANLSDNRRKKGTPLSIYDGIPISVKDNYLMDQKEVTAGSRMLKGFISPIESTMTQKLKDKGFIILGTTNMDEFCMGNSGHTINGQVLNPWSRKAQQLTIPGGSSSGCAVSVSSYQCFGGLGSDTGGSIRLPAAFCGVVGLRPSYGRCSRYGLISYANSMDTPVISHAIGFIGRSVDDCFTLLQCCEGYDYHDSTSLSLPPLSLLSSSSSSAPLSSYTIGIPREYHLSEITTAVKNNWNDVIALVKRMGAQIKEVSIPSTLYSLPTYYLLSTAEASSNLSRYDGIRYGNVCHGSFQNIILQISENRSEHFGEEVQRRILLGTFSLSNRGYQPFFRQSQKIRSLLIHEYAEVFHQGVDILLTPSSISTAPSLINYQSIYNDESIHTYLYDIMLVGSSLCGLPSLSQPSGIEILSSSSPTDSQNPILPLSIHLIANQFQEEKLYHISRLIEKEINFSHLYTPLTPSSPSPTDLSNSLDMK